MSVVSTPRASYQSRPIVPGFGKRSKPKPIVSAAELNLLNQAVASLNHAKHDTNEAAFMQHVSQAFKISRDLFRGRND